MASFFTSLRNLFSRKNTKTYTSDQTINYESYKKSKSMPNKLRVRTSQDSSKKSHDTNTTGSVNATSAGDNFYFKNGRRYNADAEISYLLPNDYDDADRVHAQHWIMREAFKRNYHAPVTDMLKKGAIVLDAGCGPATWTFEMAENFPSSTFYGVDACRVFPETVKPANVEFSIGNIAKNIPYPDNHFDYVFQRFLFVGLTMQDWQGNVKELFRVLKPGAYVEIVEPNAYLENKGPLTTTLVSTAAEMLASHNMSLNIGPHLETWLKELGFINVQVITKTLNINHTDKAGVLFWDIYKSVYTNLHAGMAAKNPEWKEIGAFENYLDECGKEAAKNKTYSNNYFILAQKPYE